MVISFAVVLVGIAGLVLLIGLAVGIFFAVRAARRKKYGGRKRNG